MPLRVRPAWGHPAVTRMLLLALLASIPAPLVAQTPDRRGEVVLTTPIYQGTTATAPIPPESHLRNEGGSDGAGLCVIASAVVNGIWQGVPGMATPGRDDRTGQPAPGKGSPLWRAAKAAPGGYHPTKLEQLIRRPA